MTDDGPFFFGVDHAHEGCVRAAIDRAERLCGERGARLTKLRRRVLELIWAGHRAVKAYDLVSALSGPGHQAKPPTVYRALEFLLEQGLVHRIDSLNAFVGCAHPSEPHQAQFLICDDCGGVSEMAESVIARAVGRQAEATGFAVRQQIIELHGTCPACTPN